MSIRWKHVRVVAVWLAGAVATVAVVPLLGQFFVSLADEQGWYAHPSVRVHAVLSALTAITASPWFHWLGGATIGFSGGVWLDAIFRKREAPSDLEVTFDPANPGGKFICHISSDLRDELDENLDYHSGPSDYVNYYIRVTNNTTKTMPRVEARMTYWPHGSTPLPFVVSGGVVSTLHPGASDYIRVWTVNKMPGHDGPEFHKREIIVSAKDIAQIQKTIKINTTKTRAITMID